MNWKKLLSIGALTMFSASIATGQGTAPTIVQGDYISNVFGNSNFIKNPNAKLNNKDVTVSNATVTRSTTTPLVATSEFLVTTSTSTGSATWSTRTFDGGMKGQNCEARFSYRGFSVGSTTAQIVQGSNVVAQLTLTPSTDPRIASINFPCGDLSSATTFRLQQATASLTGTNEIGGIYVGLATNMANVAQAEFIGSLSYQDNGSCQWTRAGTGANFGNFAADTDCPINQVTGVCSDAGKIPGMTCNLTKPGRYEVIVQQRSRTSGTSGVTNLYRIHDGTTGGPTSVMYQSPNITGYDAIQTQTLTASYEYTTGGTKTFQVQASTGVGNTSFIYGNETNPVWEMKVYRFPSSSELVVTPERQPWYISANHSGASPSLATGVVGSRTEITDASLTLTPDSGSQPVATLCSGTNTPPALTTAATTCAAGNESLGLTFNIPSVGSYEVCAQFSTIVTATAGSVAETAFSIEETATNANTALTSNKANTRYQNVTSSQASIMTPFRQCNIIQFSSIGQKAVRLMYSQGFAGTISSNAILGDNYLNRAIVWSVKPVTNQSNSALYVQGPVQAAATGAAIPAGYVFEHTSSNHSFTITNNAALTQNITSFSLNPGVWMVESSCNFRSSASGTTAWVFGAIGLSGDSGSMTGVDEMSYTFAYMAHLTASQYYNLMAKRYINVTSTTTYYLNTQNAYGANNPTVACTLKRTRLN